MVPIMGCPALDIVPMMGWVGGFSGVDANPDGSQLYFPKGRRDLAPLVIPGRKFIPQRDLFP
jgi:hypothetical protein